MSSVICPDCKRQIAMSAPRVVLEGIAVCRDCAYYREMGRPNPYLKLDDKEKSKL